MIAIVCLLVPSAILVYVREKLFENHESIYKTIFNYAVSVLIMNGFVMALLYFVFGNNGNLFSNLNEHTGFPSKYITLTVVIALAEPYIEMLLKKKVRVVIELPENGCHFQCSRVVAVFYSIILFLLNFIRIFDNNFWEDEAYTAYQVSQSVPDIISKTAVTEHPPLYYLLVKAGYEIVGNQGWMYHLVSFIPFIVILVLSLTVFWKNLGKEAAFILMTLAALSDNAVQFNVEVRMYSWGALFVLLSFYSLYLILKDEKITHYTLFIVFSLAAAYTHYYCLVSVAFLYVVILFLSIFKKRLSLKKVLASCVVTVVGYLPWLPSLIGNLMQDAENFWMKNIPTFESSIKYLFSSQFSDVVWICIFIGLILVVLYETNILEFVRDSQKWKVSISLRNIKYSNDLIWIISGAICILGTIGFGLGISYLIRPFYTLRYIYPVSVIAWVILGVGVSKLKLRKPIAVLLVVYMLATFLPSYAETYVSEKNENDRLQVTLAATEDVIQEDDVILADLTNFNWSKYRYYYSGIAVVKTDLSAFPELDEGTCYWLFKDGSSITDAVYAQIESQGFSCTQVVEDGVLGTQTVYVYCLSAEAQE